LAFDVLSFTAKLSPYYYSLMQIADQKLRSSYLIRDIVILKLIGVENL